MNFEAEEVLIWAVVVEQVGEENMIDAMIALSIPSFVGRRDEPLTKEPTHSLASNENNPARSHECQNEW